MKIWIVDAQRKVRFALRMLLEHQCGLEVAAEADNAADLMNLAGKDCPDLLLLDWELSGAEPVLLMKSIHALWPALSVIVITGRAEGRQTALDAGAIAFIHKGSPPENLLAAVQQVKIRKEQERRI